MESFKIYRRVVKIDQRVFHMPVTQFLIMFMPYQIITHLLKLRNQWFYNTKFQVLEQNFYILVRVRCLKKAEVGHLYQRLCAPQEGRSCTIE